MKRLLYSLVMMIALVIGGGSAMGQTKTKPIPGRTYSYSLSGIKVITEGTVTIAYSGDGASVKNVTGATGDAPNYVVPVGGITLGFDIEYDVTATSGTITVTVTDGAASSCSNFIELAVVVTDPTLALSIAASDAGGPLAELCQNKNTSPLDDDNTAATINADDNTFVFTVTPHATVSTDYDYDYTIDLSTLLETGLTNYTIGHSGSGNFDQGTGEVTGADPAVAEIFTITFKTTTGKALTNISGTITAATLNDIGGGEFSGVVTGATATVNVNTMPSIGVFAE